MGLFDWLFGGEKHTARSATVKRPSAPPPSFSVRDGHIDVPARRFFGRCVQSPNGRYTLAWRDANDEGTHGGGRSTGPGRYMLFDRDQVSAEGKMDRPNDGKVANDGTLILNDWGFVNGLKGTFYAFSSDGQKRITRKFRANLYNNGLSDDGRLAVCQTCNAPSSDFSTVLPGLTTTSLMARMTKRWR